MACIAIETERHGTYWVPEPVNSDDAKLQAIYRHLAGAYDEFHGMSSMQGDLPEIQKCIVNIRECISQMFLDRLTVPE